MNLHPLLAELAVMNILGEHRLRASESLAQTVVVTSWRRYGMREHDLVRAIERLQALGMVESRRKGGRRDLVLSQTGSDWLNSLRGICARTLLLPRLVRNLFKQVRPGSTQTARRRKGDLRAPED